jgi:hypothetical protein
VEAVEVEQGASRVTHTKTHPVAYAMRARAHTRSRMVSTTRTNPAA